MKNTTFAIQVVEGLSEWSKTEPRLVKKVFDLLIDIHKHPFEGI